MVYGKYDHKQTFVIWYLLPYIKYHMVYGKYDHIPIFVIWYILPYVNFHIIYGSITITQHSGYGKYYQILP